MRILAVLVICPFITGCIGFACPAISHTPSIQVDEPGAQAFRIASEFVQSGSWMTGPISFTTSIEDLPAEKGLIPRQANNYWYYYYLVFPLVEGGKSKYLEVRLYRRGFETVTVPTVKWWTSPTVKPVWNPALSLEELEKAIDNIAGPDHCPPPGSVRDFISAEYTWLAHSPWAAGPGQEKDRERLLAKAGNGGTESAKEPRAK